MAEIILDMIRIGHRIKIRIMTGVTFYGRVCITAGMAGDTGLRYMSSGQWELGIVMAECRRFPGRCRMTLGAEMVKIVLHMVGVAY